ncbi:TIGR03668 family PPOX class F420-dependent oxidoreductase [Streptomyces sp. NPDC047108]|uniref:TIGR03668 family PPOX class F420-dependent oxidoreductase n=1 Tax=Streptomyces sp. NPDC047108 TaxID=3155025 RepID=UPI0033F20BBA
MELQPAEARRRFAAARVARLATVSDDGRPHLVPVTFVLDGDMLFSAVDDKPKRTADLRRLRTIRANPAVTLLADHYAEDWTTLWWARADGTATVVEDETGRARPVALLREKYPQYREQPPRGPVVAVTVDRWSGWSYAL